jgi:hypothetical protein
MLAEKTAYGGFEDSKYYSYPIYYGLLPAFNWNVRSWLVQHLRSLNLEEIITQIPRNEEEAARRGEWIDDFMASLRGLMRKNYPTIYLSQ